MADHPTTQTATNTPAPVEPIDPLRLLRFMYCLAVSQFVFFALASAFRCPWWVGCGLTWSFSLSWWRFSVWAMRRSAPRRERTPCARS